MKPAMTSHKFVYPISILYPSNNNNDILNKFESKETKAKHFKI